MCFSLSHVQKYQLIVESLWIKYNSIIVFSFVHAVPLSSNKLSSRVGNPTVGAASPLIERRDIHDILNKHLCTTCKNGPSCKLRNNCNACEGWCGSKETTSSNSQIEPVVGSPVEPNLLIQSRSFELPKPSIVDSSGQITPESQDAALGGQDSVAMATRSNVETKVTSNKKAYTVEPFAVQPMRGVITRLLGISNMEDVEDMGIWVTTLSNEPPAFGRTNNAERVLNLCRDAGKELQEEAQNGAKEMITFMWDELQKNIQKRIYQHDKPLVSREEMGEIIQDFFKNVRHYKYSTKVIIQGVSIYFS